MKKWRKYFSEMAELSFDDKRILENTIKAKSLFGVLLY